jgi:protein-L-isoaspartate(D-aspartate) O-methyltransferase
VNDSLDDREWHQKLRERLVDEVRQKGITDEAVLDAIGKVPRHLFLSEEQENLAYVDKAVPIGQGQTISQPYTVAYQTQLLEVKPEHKILEIGTGSGYQASILATMGAEVYTIERQKKLFEKNKEFDYLQSFSNIHFFYGDGYNGLKQYAPFDKILITAAAPYIPPRLVDQLHDNGAIVVPVGTQRLQEMLRVTKNEDDELVKEVFDLFSFVPMLKGKE